MRANDAGRCVVDAARDPLRQGRARLGCTFHNRARRSSSPVPEEGEREPQPGIGSCVLSGGRRRRAKLAQRWPVSGFGSVTWSRVQLRYDPVDQLLYLVDVTGRGLMPIPLDPLPASATLLQLTTSRWRPSARPRWSSSSGPSRSTRTRILFFRLGDFYEMFFDDAVLGVASCSTSR